MHTLRRFTSLTLLACACGGTDAGTSTDTDPATTTSEVVTTGHAGTTHDSDHHDSDHHDTGTTADTHADHGTEPATTDAGTPAEQYCACMLESCHDLYHATWGEDHEASETMCMAAAEAVPSVGAPAMSGNSIECRLYFCAMGHEVANACEAALGAAPCAD